MKRRDFIRKGFYSSFVVASAATVFASCSDDDNNTDPKEENGEDDEGTEIDLNSTDFEKLKTEGEYVHYKDYIIINTGNGFLALSKKCTHQGCDVTYNHDDNNLPCPCHGSIFNTNGSVENGPAETALTVYTVNRNEDILTIK